LTTSPPGSLERSPQGDQTTQESPSLARLLAEVAFLQSAAKVSELPGAGVPEIAIAGRSNAGKSTALNVLCQRRKLAFASKTPGRTRLINLFALSCLEQDIGRLVDLPGYGYAKVDAQTQRRWKAELSRYLESRPNLVGLILVSDIRHALGPLDQQMLNWFGPRGLPLHILLTKADKFNRQDQAKALQAAKTLSRCSGQPLGWTRYGFHIFRAQAHGP
jgi:ribosome biogenesis GTP-binding protein YsxC/EngB